MPVFTTAHRPKLADPPRAPRRAPWLLVALAVSVVASACAASQTDRVAPYRDRPDSTGAGSLRGPFTGQVRDATTGDPVRGAVVYASWSFTSGYGDQVPAGYADYTASTDDQGRYAVPALAQVPKGARLTGAYIVVYKPGYVAYRSDRRFSDRGLRRDFAQRHNEVSLLRWQPQYSHAEHVRFLGGGEALAVLTADERARAAAELVGDPDLAPPLEPDFETVDSEGGPDDEPIAEPMEPRAPDAPLPDLPRAAELLTAALVEEITGDEGPFEASPLADQPDTSTYSSQHIRAVDRPEDYDVALRVWAEGGAAATARYEALERSLPEAETRDEIADRSLLSAEPGIKGVAFVDAERGVVVLLVCGEGLCPSEEVASELARAVYAGIVGEPAPAVEPDVDSDGGPAPDTEQPDGDDPEGAQP
jgi:hypothetical protein